MLRPADLWNKRNRIAIISVSAALILVLAVVDWLTKPYFSIGFLYLFPNVRLHEMGRPDFRQRCDRAHRRRSGPVCVSVQTGVIMVEYINQLRARGHTIFDAARDGAILRLRPIMMTMLVATLGLAPGGYLARHRLGFAAPFRDCDCRR